MIIVADSGSTKTAWAFCPDSANEGNKALQDDAWVEKVCEGLNPHFTTDNQYLELGNWLRKSMKELGWKEGIESVAIYFYGAGCGTLEKQQYVEKLLFRALPEAGKVTVAGDLLGACRALYGSSTGIVGILGTGSNACYYNGESIVNQVFSTGYLLGDEGSGNHIGRRLLKSYLTLQMPPSLRDAFLNEYEMSNAAFLDQIYRKPNPNRFLASLAPFALKHKDEPFIEKLLGDVFEAYICEMVLPVTPKEDVQCELRIVGGIAAHFGHEIEIAAKKHGIALTTTLERPLDQLVKFHQC